MVKVEILLVGVLLILALLVGVFFRGSSMWFLKPQGSINVIDKVTTKYVCYDGSVKDSQSQCPIISNINGQMTTTCPPCKQGNATITTTQCSCLECAARCGAILPSPPTTIAPPQCKNCTANGDCGQPFYGDLKCRNGQEYKLYNEPLCDKGCCATKQSQSNTRTCTDTETCSPLKGCIPIPPDQTGSLEGRKVNATE